MNTGHSPILTQQPDNLFGLVFEASPSGMLLVNQTGVLALVNTQVERLFGYTRQELLGQPIDILIPERYRRQHPGQFHTFFTSPSLRAMGRGCNLSGRRKDGTEFPIEIGLNPIPLPQSMHVLALITDVTERKQSEEALQQAHDELEQRVHERTKQMSEINAALQQELAERQQAEAAFHEALASLDATIDGIFVFDPHTLQFSYVNEGAAQQTGYGRKELLRMTPLDIKLDFDEPGFRTMLAPLISGQLQIQTFTTTHRKKNGTELPVEVNLQYFGSATARPRLIAIVRDITERKQIEQALQQTKNLFTKAFRSSPHPLIITEMETGRCLEVNDDGLRLFGYQREEVIGRTMMDLGLWPTLADRDKLFQYLATHGSIRNLELQFKGKDGAPRHCLVSCEQVDLNGQRCLLTVGTDITDHRLAEATVKQRETQLQQMQKLEAVGRLAGGVAHEFNNLLTGINGNIELLLKQVEPWSPLYQRLNTVRTAGQKAAKITKQLLTLGRQHIAQPERLNLNGAIENLSDLLQQILGEDIRLTLTLAPALGVISVDPGQLDQILLNLASNARDAMPSGGTLAIETMNVSNPSRAVRLVTRDTGQGMSPDVQAHIFEPFFTTKEFGKGTGLGLATVYGIMAQSGGTIAVYSAIGKGTTFSLTFPRVDREAMDTVNHPDHRQAATQTILLVDDDIIVREIAREMLTMQGYQVLEAPNGQEALQQMAATTSPIHLLVTDIMMPGMNGRELAEQLLAKHPTLRVVFMSGYNEDELLRKGISSQSVTFVAKPFTINSLSSAVKAVLDGEHNP